MVKFESLMEVGHCSIFILLIYSVNSLQVECFCHN